MFEEQRSIRQHVYTHLPLSHAVSSASHHSVYGQPDRKGQRILTVLLVLACVSGVVWLSRPRAASAPLFSELWLSGSISLQSEVTATCQGGVVTIDNAIDDYTSQHTPFRLQLVPQTTLAYGYYSLPNSALAVRLELLDQHGSSSQVFSVYEGTVDLRLEGIYLSTRLRNAQGASVFVSGQTVCLAS